MAERRDIGPVSLFDVTQPLAECMKVFREVHDCEPAFAVVHPDQAHLLNESALIIRSSEWCPIDWLYLTKEPLW